MLRGGLHLLHAVPVPRPHHAAGDDPAGQDRLRLRARRPAAAADADAGVATPTARDFQDVARLPARRRPARPAAPDPARRHLRASTSRSSSSSPRTASTTCRSTQRRAGAVRRRWRELIDERDGFAPVVIKGADDLIGVVTVHDGPSLPPGEIIAPTVGDDPTTPRPTTTASRTRSTFLAAGGRRGRQLQVLVEGTYYINRLFATVELIAKTVVEVGHVGVVVSLHRRRSAPTSRATTYTHGELVETRPARRVERAAAARQVRVQHLRRQGDHGADHQLHPEVDPQRDRRAQVRREPVRGVADHQGRVRADRCRSRWSCTSTTARRRWSIQRFGDIKQLVEQTLDPMVSAYFKNVGQTRTLIQLHPGPQRRSRSSRRRAR